MAETLMLRFRVFNAGVAKQEVETEIDGEPATIVRRKLHVDAEPLDGTEKTLELILPADLAETIKTGCILHLAIEVEAAPETPAEEA